MIPNWVNNYVGIPYSELGRSHESCDCYGLIVLIYKEIFNIKLPSLLDKYSKVDKNIVNIYNEERDKWKEVNQPKIGDIAYFKICGHNMHVGIYLTNKLFLHNISKKGSSSIAEFNNTKWKNRLIGFWSYE